MLQLQVTASVVRKRIDDFIVVERFGESSERDDPVEPEAAAVNRQPAAAAG